MEVIENLPPPILVKGVRSFLGHVVFYRRFIKDLSKVASPLCKLLEKEVKFSFDDDFLKHSNALKNWLRTLLLLHQIGQNHLRSGVMQVVLPLELYWD